MNRPLVDVNVVLDALLDRRPHGPAAARIWKAAAEKRVAALAPAHGVTTLFYLVRQGKGAAAAREAVDEVLSVFGVAPVARRGHRDRGQPPRGRAGPGRRGRAGSPVRASVQAALTGRRHRAS